MPRRLFSLLFTILVIGGCLGCQFQKAPANDGFSYTDALGNSVKLPAKPQRVAVLFSSLADVWVTAGGTVAITVGESVERGFAANNTVLVDGGAGKNINIESLLRAEPDFVICSADIPAQAKVAQICIDAGIPAASFRIESFEDYLHVLDIFTDITERKDLMELYGSQLSKEIQCLLQDYASHSTDRSYLFIRAGSTARSTKAKNAEQHFACKMLNKLGLNNIADQAPVLLDGLSLENILQEDPDYIFITTMGDRDSAIAYMESVLKQPQWASLSAVKNGNVIYLPKDMFQYKPNARWGDAYRHIINIIISQNQGGTV